MTSSTQTFAIDPRLNWMFSILKLVDDVNHLKTNSTKLAHYRLRIRKVIEFYCFHSLMQHPLSAVFVFENLEGFLWSHDE